MFEKKFPSKVISPSRLSLIYKKNKVKKKVVRRVKRGSPAQIDTRLQQQRFMVSKMKEMMRRKVKIIYLDEVCFTKKTMQSSAYAAKGCNIQVDEMNIYSKPSYVIASVSQERGVEHVVKLQQPICSSSFIDYVKQLVRKNKHVKFCLFMDNLPAHRSRDVMTYLKNNNVQYIFNVPYSPQFNPIESVFGKVKPLFKRRKLQALQSSGRYDQDREIRMAFDSVSKSDVVGYCKMSFACMYEFDI